MNKLYILHINIGNWSWASLFQLVICRREL